MINSFIKLTKSVLSQEITPKQAWYKIQMRLFNTQKNLKDDFDWNQYHLIYKEELKSIAKTGCVLPQPGDFVFENKKIVAKRKEQLPMLPGHHLLYEIILNLNPSSALEVGCGGGDHLRNLTFFLPTLKVVGIDRSEKQLETLRERHPQLKADLQVQDLTVENLALPRVDVIYSQAVLMHISEGNGRFKNAIQNIFQAAQKQVVMMENWSHHNFLEAFQNAIAANKEWAGAKIYFTYRSEAPGLRAVIVSKTELPYELLTNNEQILMGLPFDVRS